jgi:tRNA(Ile)-lysidine synthase
MDIVKSPSGPTPPLIKQVADTIKRHKMLDPEDKVLIGVSGGTDSVALLHLMVALRPVMNLQLAVAHLNHGLRPGASDREADFVKELSRRLGICFHCEKIELDPHRGSLEARARRARYRFYQRLLHEHGYTKLALGHQADDNAESVLLHLLRGSGIRGLSGIPPKRAGAIVRPLIETRRSDIEAYLKAHGIAHIEDASNNDMRFQRNRIRHHLMPLLQRDYNPNIHSCLNRLAGLCRDEQTWLRTMIQPMVESISTDSGPEGLELRADGLLNAPTAAQRRLIRTALRNWLGDLKRVGRDHIDAVIDLLYNQATGSRLNLPRHIVAERTIDGVRFGISLTRGEAALGADSGFNYTIPLLSEGERIVQIPEAGCRLQFTIAPRAGIEMRKKAVDNVEWFDMDSVEFPLTVRNHRPGDRLWPYGLLGSQKVNKIFIDRKIPRCQRSRVPIVTQGDNILWIAGVRRGSAAPVLDTTQQLLKIEMVQITPPQRQSHA